MFVKGNGSICSATSALLSPSMAALHLSPFNTFLSLRTLSVHSSDKSTANFSLISPNKHYPCFSSISPKLQYAKARASAVITAAAKILCETELVSVPASIDAISGSFPPDAGVYAVYDKNDDLQFIGITRNIAASILTHRKSLSELCYSVKFGIVDNPDRTALTQAWKSWMEEHIKATGKVPPGNETGNSTWVRQPPKKKPDLRLTPGRHVQLTVPLEQLIDRLVKENKVVAFIKGSRSAPLCGFSQKVVGILESQGVDYESVDVLDEEYNYGLRETLKQYSNWPTFPQIFVDGQLIGGCDILTSMHDNGEIAGMLKK